MSSPRNRVIFFTNADEPLPILAWRIGRDSECDCVLPVTCLGTHGSQTYVLRPDGKVSWNAVSYGSAAPEYESLAEWHDYMTGQNEPPKKKNKKLQAAKMDTDGIPDF